MKHIVEPRGARTLRAVSRLVSTPVRNALTLLRGLLDELTDQTAYRRYLTAHGVEHSPTAWREFQDEHWQAKSRRGRCC